MRQTFIHLSIAFLGLILVLSSCSKKSGLSEAPSSPSPLNGATEIPVIGCNLSWNSTYLKVGKIINSKCDIYLGSDSAHIPKWTSGVDSLYQIPTTLDSGKTYYWYVVAFNENNDSTVGSTWHFTTVEQAPNIPPKMPSNPSPSDAALKQSINVSLNWAGGDTDPSDTVKYDVYFGTSSNPPLVSPNLADTTYKPDSLNYNKTYYWKISAKDNHGNTTEGSIWSFTVGHKPNSAPNMPSNPSPSDAALKQSINVSLNWAGGDTDPSDTVKYDVYFGTSSNPPLVSPNLADTIYKPGSLNYNKIYYWKISAKDNHGNTTEGSIWSFTVRHKPNSAPNTPNGLDCSSNIVIPIGTIMKGIDVATIDTFSGIIPTDPDGDLMYYKIDFGDGYYTSWIGPYYAGTRISQTHKYRNPTNENGRICIVTWKVKDTHGKITKCWHKNSIAVGHAGMVQWQNQELSGDIYTRSRTHSLNLNSNGWLYRVKLDVNDGSSVNLTLHDPLAHLLFSFPNIYNIDRVTRKSSGIAGTWKLKIEKTLGTAHYNVYMFYLQFPPSFSITW